ncbi:MAG: aquaporin family protein [Chitinispirillia bacterium]|nr:aquaporin family protein [Chitinispirillia bacterium]
MQRKVFLGELIGTFLLVLFGTGSVAVSVLFGAHQGLFQIAIIWGIAVTLAIYAARHLSCAHFNPAVTIAMVVSGRMAPQKMKCYLVGQFAGAFLAGLAVYLIFSPSIAAFEAAEKIVRGAPESVAVAKMFGEYYIAEISMWSAIAAEAFGTFLLVLMIFFLTESCNVGKPDNNLVPLFIGLTVTSIICLIAPLTQAGLNPARDFGPRMVSWIFGWGEAAFPDSKGGFFWVYMLGPILGGITAAIAFTKVIEPAMKIEAKDCHCEEKKSTKSNLTKKEFVNK